MNNHYRAGYPRPQFIRENYENLNGLWGFSFDDANEGLNKHWNKGFLKQHDILVPFSYETAMSGIHEEAFHAVVWYERMLTLQRNSGKRIILHFEGSDYHTQVFLNGQAAGTHTGGYTRFSCDITDLVKDGENLLVVRVEDSMSMSQPRGKQRWKPENFGCWYVQTTGLWKSVWMEEVACVRISSAKITPFPDEQEAEFIVCIDGLNDEAKGAYHLEAEVSLDGRLIGRVGAEAESEVSLTVRIADSEGKTELWYPEAPVLYDVVFRLYQDEILADEVFSYLGMRKIETDGARLLLNGKEIFLRMVLDQGYWEESGMTPPSEEAIVYDIRKTLDYGFNGARKHQKVEDERYYYYADILGLLVWHEIPAFYEFNEKACEAFRTEWMDAVRQHYNHPAIVTWVPFNESWGPEKISGNREEQEYTIQIKNLTKAYDPYRPVISNDGWEHTESDLITLHDYDSRIDQISLRYKNDLKEILENSISHNCYKLAFAQGFSYGGQPIIISEYGGIAVEGSEGWGYNEKAKNNEECLKLMGALTKVYSGMPLVSGYCYTQLTDVQQEVNGLMDYRHKDKFPAEQIRKIMSEPKLRASERQESDEQELQHPA